MISLNETMQINLIANKQIKAVLWIDFFISSCFRLHVSTYAGTKNLNNATSIGQNCLGEPTYLS